VSVCRDHRLLLFLPNRRAAMLTLLLRYGQLCGRAKEEAERQGRVRLNKPQEVEAPTSSKADARPLAQAKARRLTVLKE